ARAEPVGGPSTDRDEHGKTQQIAGDRDVEGERAFAERPRDCRQCRGDDGRIEVLHEHRAGDDQRYQNRMGRRVRGCDCSSVRVTMATFSGFLSAFSGEGMTFRIRRARGIALPAGLLALTACTATPTIVENSATEVAVRYDGIVNKLDDARQVAQRACAARDKVARLR